MGKHIEQNKVYKDAMAKGNIPDAADALEALARSVDLDHDHESMIELLYQRGETVRDLSSGEEISVVRLSGIIIDQALEDDLIRTDEFLEQVKTRRFQKTLEFGWIDNDWFSAAQAFLEEVCDLPEDAYEKDPNIGCYDRHGDTTGFHQFMREKYQIEMTQDGGENLVRHLGLELHIRVGLEVNHSLPDPYGDPL